MFLFLMAPVMMMSLIIYGDISLKKKGKIIACAKVLHAIYTQSDMQFPAPDTPYLLDLSKVRDN
jgi:hypothetical protein